MKADRFRREDVRFIPRELQPGVIYISREFATCAHLCACGCGTEIHLPLSPYEWQMTSTGERVSLDPSIGNWSFPCQSHYWIIEGKVRWSGRLTQAAIDAGRRVEDDRMKRRYGRKTWLSRVRGAFLRRWDRTG